MGFIYALRSEQEKTKHTSFWAIHFCVPVMGALLFLAYYSLYASTADSKKLKMILEITTTFFPLLISVIVGLNVALEEKASHFQTLLAVPNRHKNMLAKLTYLYGSGVFALFFLFLLFVIGIVDVNGGYHKAVISENVKDSDTVFDFKKTEESINDSFEVNPENATQLLWGGTVYQVTSDMVSDDELGSYIDILAESVTFDTETKIPLSKEDLSKIDWYGKNGGQGRESWFYTDVYEIYGTDKAEAVAVNVNDNYYIAKRQ